MKKIEIYSVIFIILCIFESCLNKKEHKHSEDFPQTIKLDLSNASTDTMNLSFIAEKIEYIPLQTTDSSLLGFDTFNSLVISKNDFFIQNEFRILRFDKEGKFVCDLFKVGRGPGEANARCFSVDEHNQRVYVFDQISKEVKIYSFTGRYINKTKKPINSEQHTTISIGYFHNNLFVTTPQNPRHKYLYSCYDLLNDSIRVICDNNRKYNIFQMNKRPLTPYDSHYQITDSTIMYKEWFNDTLLKMNKKYLSEPRYIIDLGEHKLDWETWRDNGMFNIAGGPPSGYWAQSFIETKSYLIIAIRSFKNPHIIAVYNKDDKSVNLHTLKVFKFASDKLYFKNDIDEIIDFPLLNDNDYFLYYNNCLFSIINAMDFIRAYRNTEAKIKKSSKYLISMIPVFNAITEFSNPIIVKIYLK